MPATKTKARITFKFIRQFFIASLSIAALWFAGVEFSHSALSRPLGGDSSRGIADLHRKIRGGIGAIEKLKGFKLAPGKTYIPGKNGVPQLVIRQGNGDSAVVWHAWKSPLQIVILITLIALVLAAMDRSIRHARRQSLRPQ